MRIFRPQPEVVLSQLASGKGALPLVDSDDNNKSNQEMGYSSQTYSSQTAQKRRNRDRDNYGLSMNVSAQI